MSFNVLILRKICFPNKTNIKSGENFLQSISEANSCWGLWDPSVPFMTQQWNCATSTHVILLLGINCFDFPSNKHMWFSFIVMFVNHVFDINILWWLSWSFYLVLYYRKGIKAVDVMDISYSYPFYHLMEAVENQDMEQQPRLGFQIKLQFLQCLSNPNPYTLIWDSTDLT